MFDASVLARGIHAHATIRLLNDRDVEQRVAWRSSATTSLANEPPRIVLATPKSEIELLISVGRKYPDS